MVEEHSLMSQLPTAVEPVKDSFFSSGEWHRAAPTSCTSSRDTVRQFTTPSGTPASSVINAGAYGRRYIL